MGIGLQHLFSLKSWSLLIILFLAILTAAHHSKSKITVHMNPKHHGSQEIFQWPQEIQRPIQFIRYLISKAKSNFHTNLASNPRTIWKTLNSILHRNPPNSDTPDTYRLPILPFNFSMTRLNASVLVTTFSPSDSPDHFLFLTTPLQIYQIPIIPTTFTEFWNSNLPLETLFQWSWFMQLSLIWSISF